MIWCIIYLKFRGVWFAFSLKLKEYKFNKSAFVLKLCPLIFENINKLLIEFHQQGAWTNHYLTKSEDT